MSEITVFNFGESAVRVRIDEHGNPWWVAKDVCEVLRIGNSRQAVARLDDDEKGVISSDTLGGTQDLQAVSESGLYSLILGSKKVEAKAFKKWVTSNVLPAIRKTGRYEGPRARREALPGHLEDTARAIHFAATSLQQLVPGMRTEMVGACTIASYERAGIPMEPMRLALPAREDAKLTVTPTQIAKLVGGGVSANYVNTTLAAMGFQTATGTGWELTESGREYGELIPFQSKYSNKGGHQIRWKPDVADLVRDWIETGKSRTVEA